MAIQGAGTNIGEGSGVHGAEDSFTSFTTSSQENQRGRKLAIPSDYRPGWLLEVAARVWGRGSTVSGKLLFYADDAEGGNILMESPTQSWNTTAQWRRYFPPDAGKHIRVESGKSYWVAWWTEMGKSRSFTISDDWDVQNANENGTGKVRGSSVFASWSGFAYEQETLAADFFYQQNAFPSTGRWRSVPSGTIPDPAPVFAGYMEHLNGDVLYDYTEAVQLQVWRTDTGAMLYDQTFEPTSSERSQKYFARQPLNLPVAVTCRAKYRHRDSWGAWSNFSPESTFTAAEGPSLPTITAPVGKLLTQTDFNITGVYKTNVGRNANAIRVRLLNETGTVPLFDTGTETISVSPDATYSFPAWFDALRWGQKYKIEVRFRDTANVWGYPQTADFYLNSPPQTPSGLTPSGSRNTGEQELQATFSDPDGDPIQRAELELYDITSGAMVAGFPKTVSVTGNNLSYNAASDLVIDRTYRWRARATDDLSNWELLSPEQRTLDSDYDDGTGFHSSAHVSGWHPFNDVFLSRSTANKRTGSHSLSLFVTPSGETKDAYAEIGIWPLESDRTFQWSLWVYSPFATYIDRSRFYLQEASGQKRTVALGGASGAFSISAGTWTQLTGSGKTPSNWGPDSQFIIRPARKSDNSAYDSTKTLYYDDFRIWATGGVWSAFSSWHEFTARSSPTVSYVAPTQGGIRNRVPEPQPDLTPTGSDFWTEVGRVEGDTELDPLVGYIDEVGDSDSAFGTSAWRAVSASAAENHLLSDYMDVDATKPMLAYLYAKKEPNTGTSSFYFEVQCYNSSNTLLGTLYPNSLGASENVDLSTSYAPRGGWIWPAGHAEAMRFPTGTAKVRFAVWPSYQSECVVRFDAVFWDHVPNVPVADMPNVQKWWGYMDGSVESYDPLISAPAHSWEGEPGTSESIGVHVARDPGLNLYVTYSHPTGVLKGADRVTVYKALATGWELVHQTAFEGGDRTTIPIPSGVVRSETRYRVVLEVRDTVGIVTEMPDILFDARFDGPPQLNILVARADNDRAEVYLSFDQSTLGIAEFAGIEIAVGADKTVVDRINDYTVTEYVYPFPVSGVDDDYWVRQVALQGSEEVEGRWDHAVVRCDYEDWWLKDVELPRDVALSFPVYALDEPTKSEAPEITSYRPWGSAARVHFVPEARPEEGGVTIRLLDREPNLATKLQVLEEMRTRWRPMCFLSHRPDERKFVIVTARDRTSAHLPFYAVYGLTWQENKYPENYYEREGVFE